MKWRAISFPFVTLDFCEGFSLFFCSFLTYRLFSPAKIGLSSFFSETLANLFLDLLTHFLDFLVFFTGILAFFMGILAFSVSILAFFANILVFFSGILVFFTVVLAFWI
jgi:hypothetical protein